MSEPETLAVLQARIRANAGAYFPELAGADVSVRCTRLPVGSNQIYRCELAPGTGARPAAELFVKIAPRPSRIEFDHLTLLHQSRSEATRALLVPRPLDFFPDINALLTEKVGGQPLARLVLRNLHAAAGPTRRAAVASWIRLCGRWLANYHRLTRSPDAAPFDQAWLGKITGRLRELESVGFPPPVVAAAHRTLSLLHEAGKRHLAPHAHRHGDFALRNVHVGDDWVCVFDLNDRSTDCVYEDLSYFAVTLETMNKWPRHPLFDRRAAIAMTAHLVEGYFGSGQACSRLVLEGHVLKHLLLRCARQRRSVESRAKRLVSAFDSFRLRRFYATRVLGQCERLDQLLQAS